MLASRSVRSAKSLARGQSAMLCRCLLSTSAGSAKDGSATNSVNRWVFAAAFGAAAVAGGAYFNSRKSAESASATPTVAKVEKAEATVAPAVKVTAPVMEPKKYPQMTAQEMKEMVEKEDKIVVAFMGSVYDITKFSGHPGGVGRLQMAAGHDLEVFWKVYTQHNRGHIVEIMQRYKIGELPPDEMAKITAETVFDNPYTNDPPMSPYLLTNTRYPYNAEMRISGLTDSFITPVGKHFVRNHSHVPDIKVEDYKLTVTGAGLPGETTFNLEDLKTKFEKVDVTTVIQCNGNRREDYHYIDGETPAFGPPHWVAGAIGCATWSGARLRDVFRAAGMDVDNYSLNKVKPPPEATMVGLTGYDMDEVGNQYCCSFSFEKAIDPFGDVIVAYEMNGEPIPRSHGFPVRCIVPGLAGARNCKYLERVEVTNTPCCENCNWKQYAVHAPDVPLFKLQDFEVHSKELKADPPVQEMPVQSMITSPSAGDMIAAKTNGYETIKVRGIAWGGGGSDVNRVDVSLDGGKNFTKADMLAKPPAVAKQRRNSVWSWVFFEKDIPIPPEMQAKLKAGEGVKLDLCSKALNSAWNVQPENPHPNRNAHGCCVNHWYHVPVCVCPTSDCCIPGPEGDFGNKPSGGQFRTPFRNLDQPKDAIARQEAEKAKACEKK